MAKNKYNFQMFHYCLCKHLRFLSLYHAEMLKMVVLLLVVDVTILLAGFLCRVWRKQEAVLKCQFVLWSSEDRLLRTVYKWLSLRKPGSSLSALCLGPWDGSSCSLDGDSNCWLLLPPRSQVFPSRVPRIEIVLELSGWSDSDGPQHSSFWMMRFGNCWR